VVCRFHQRQTLHAGLGGAVFVMFVIAEI